MCKKYFKFYANKNKIIKQQSDRKLKYRNIYIYIYICLNLFDFFV
jgi:hypothetical protein